MASSPPTIPGQIPMKRTPSFLYSTLNLAVTTFMAALVMVYSGDTCSPMLLIIPTSARPLVMQMTFLVWPLRMSGRNRL